MKKLLKRFSQKDNGFSLLEVSIATAIMVIGFSIAAPALNNALADASVNQTKSNLYQASLVVEDARYQNEGAYPTDMPTQLVSNPDMADFRYTYSDDQSIYCLMARDDSGQKWFMSNLSTEPYKPTPDVPGCTQANLGAGSKTVGMAPTIIPPSVTGENTWDFGTYDYAQANLQWSGATCNPASNDPEPGQVQLIEYQARTVNTSSGQIKQVNSGEWMTGTSVTGLALSDWIPGDTISYQVRMRCTYDYETYYETWVSTPDTIKTFPVYASLVKKIPAPTMTWTFTQEFPVISYSGTEITCPIIASPRYRAVVSQGSQKIVFGWMSSPTYNNLSLTNFIGGTDVYFLSEASCKINNTYYVANSGPPSNINIADNYDTSGPGGSSGPIAAPEPPPASIMGIQCVTKYQRLDEASKGNCTYDASIADSTYVPNAVKWNSPGCGTGYEIEYFVRRTAPNAFDWQSLGTTSQYNINDNSVSPGSTATYEVKAKCNKPGFPSSAFSQAATISFKTSWKPSDGSAIQFAWTPSTADVSWSSTSQEGSGYLYDRMTGAATSTCQNGTVPTSYRIQVSSDGGTTYYTATGLASSVINRSILTTQGDTFWPMGLSIQTRSQAVCSDPLGDYADIPSTYSNWSSVQELGYSSPSQVNNLKCVTKYSRVTEASRGACTYDSAVAAQTYTPDLIKWDAAVCVSGYTPHYYIRSTVGATVSAWTNITTQTSYLPATLVASYTPGTSVKYEVKYVCEKGSKYSTDSALANKTFQVSYQPIATNTIQFNWTPTENDSSWGAYGNYGGVGYYFWDQFQGTPTSNCSNGTAPTSYNIQLDRWGMGTYSGISNAAPVSGKAQVGRSQIAYPDSYWPQGSGMGVHAQAICSDPYGDYSPVTQNYSDWAGAYYMAIWQPSAPASAWNDGWGGFYWSAPSSGCPSVDGGYFQYYARQGRYGNEWGWWGAYGWGTNTSTGLARYTEGYPFDMYARARCVSRYGVVSPESGETASYWTANLNNYGTWISTWIRHGHVYSSGCPGGSWAGGQHLYAKSGAGLNHGWFWGDGTFFGQYYGGGNDGSTWMVNGNYGSSYAYSGYTNCNTSWRTSGWSFGWEGTDGNYIVY